MFLLAAVNVETVKEFLIAEFDVHSAFFVEGNIEEFAGDVLGLAVVVSIFEDIVQINLGGHIAIQIFKNLFDVGDGTLCGI